MFKPLPKDGLVRARNGLELRDADDDGMPTLAGHFAVFNQFTEINSIFEGRFLERIAPGAFAKTIDERGEDVRVLFQHGHDPLVGDKPLGPIRELAEDEHGVRYEVPMLDTTYNRELLPGLEAGLYGASFRFRVTREEIEEEPERSEANPDGIPERTIQELQLHEFGPVTFPAYAGATAGVRSMTDERIFDQLKRDFPERMRELVEYVSKPEETGEDAPTPSAGKTHPQRAPRKSQTTRSRRGREFPKWKL